MDDVKVYEFDVADDEDSKEGSLDLALRIISGVAQFGATSTLSPNGPMGFPRIRVEARGSEQIEGVQWCMQFHDYEPIMFQMNTDETGKKERNQCDGCQAGKPVDKNGNHTMSETNGYRDLMGCQKGKYITKLHVDLPDDEFGVLMDAVFTYVDDVNDGRFKYLAPGPDVAALRRLEMRCRRTIGQI